MRRACGLLVLLALGLAPSAAAAPVPYAPPDAPPQLPTLAQQQRVVSRLAATGKPVYCAGPGSNAVALTFDDGPGPYTEQLLDELRRVDARATFFLVGNRLRDWPGLAREDAGRGAVGDHSWSHPRLTDLPRWDVWLELARTRLDVRSALGTAPRLFRAPYELHDAAVDGVARQLGMLQVFWSVVSGDDRPDATPARVVRNVTAGLRPGAIVLLHDIHPWTVRALPRILQAIRARGLRAVSVPELLALDPPGPDQHCPFAAAAD